MNAENQLLVRERARDAGDHLVGKLPDHPAHPAGRNPHAHVWRVVKSKMGRSYKECDDSDVPAILMIIEHCKNNPF